MAARKSVCSTRHRGCSSHEPTKEIGDSIFPSYWAIQQPAESRMSTIRRNGPWATTRSGWAPNSLPTLFHKFLRNSGLISSRNSLRITQSPATRTQELRDCGSAFCPYPACRFARHHVHVKLTGCIAIFISEAIMHVRAGGIWVQQNKQLTNRLSRQPGADFGRFCGCPFDAGVTV
jgi:hypothetical protein